jgi:hypothetical protein
MKQFHTIAAILLVLCKLGLTDSDDSDSDGVDRIQFATFDTFRAKDLSELPDRQRFMSVARASKSLMDALCNQEVEGPQALNPGSVSGAYNVKTGQFLTWDQYVKQEGENENYGYYMASGQWQTFWGYCSLQPESTWIERSYTTFGKWRRNKGRIKRTRVKVSKCDVRLAGFTVYTTTVAWREQCKNVDDMAEIFRDMPLPADVKMSWKGLDRRVEAVKPMQRELRVPAGFKGRTVATTVVRVVNAKLVFHVMHWFWHDNDASRGTGNTWQNMGGEWSDVYADLAWVEAKGLCQQLPDLPDSDPNVDGCINMAIPQIVALEPRDYA